MGSLSYGPYVLLPPIGFSNNFFDSYDEIISEAEVKKAEIAQVERSIRCG